MGLRPVQTVAEVAQAWQDKLLRVQAAIDDRCVDFHILMCLFDQGYSFRRGFRRQPLLARLADDHRLETYAGWLVLAPDCTVPALTDEGRTLAVAGVAAQWAYPAADTLMGAKYAAHGFTI